MSSGAMGRRSVLRDRAGTRRRQDEEASALVLHDILIAMTIGGIFAIVLAGFPRMVLGAIGGPQQPRQRGLCDVMVRSRVRSLLVDHTLASVLAAAGRHALRRVYCW